MNPQVRLRAVQIQMDLGNNHSSLGWTIVAKNAGKASLHQFICLGNILEYTPTSTSHHRTELSLLLNLLQKLSYPSRLTADHTYLLIIVIILGQR